jgi:exonuclease III
MHIISTKLTPRPRDSHRVRVAMQNVWARYGAWDERRGVLIDGLRHVAPDLVAFVEAVRSDGYDETEDLLGPGYEVAYTTSPTADGVGVSIASRWPLGEVHEVGRGMTPRTGDFQGTTLVAEIRAPDPVGPLLFVAGTRSWQMGYERERELQAVATARFVEQLVSERKMHVVIAGDFDATPDAASIRFASPWTA